MKRRETAKHFYMHKIANLLNVQKIVTIHYQELERGYSSAEEMHDFWEIIYVDKQEISVVKDSAGSLLRQGEIVIYQAQSACIMSLRKRGSEYFHHFF